MKRRHRGRRGERGAAIVEFAIVLPVLLLILLSMVDFGRYFYVRISLSSASIEVADAISRGLFTTSDGADSKRSKMLMVINDVSPGIAGFAQLTTPADFIFPTLPEACPNSAQKTAVQITTAFNSISPLFSFFSNAKSSASMRCLG